jgi:hypothetical protein
MEPEEAKELQDYINEVDLKELSHYYGGWDELREVIKRLEDNDKEAAIERYYTNY